MIFYLLMIGAGSWCAYDWLVYGGGHRGIAFRAGGFLAAFGLYLVRRLGFISCGSISCRRAEEGND
jgi:hypothetical protein